tara:strand:+ start:86 stop:706 length:621 start_codon:yes stop_codon:yes gene_type:complete
MARGKRGSGAKNKGGTTYKNPKPSTNVRGSGTGKTQYSKNKRQKERKQTKGQMSNIPPVVKSTGESHKDYEIRVRQEQGGYIPPGMTKSDGTPVKPQQGGGGDKGRKYETGRGGLRIPNPFKNMDADKWAAMAKATEQLANAAGERAKASRSTLDVKATKVRSNNKSAYNYFPKKMSIKTKDSTSPLVNYGADSDYEKKKKRLGLS